MPITLERIPHDKQVAVHALHTLGYSTRKIAQAVDVSTNVACAITRQVPSNSAEIDAYKKGIIAWNYGISMRSMHRISDEKLDNMNALQLMTISAIGIDKARDMEGSNRPVVNIVTMVGDMTKSLAELERKQSALLALESNQTSTVI